MYLLAIYSPLGACQLITHTVYGSWQTRAYGLLAIQFLWVLLLAITAVIMFHFAKKKVSINGG
jgi:hypothetical protein